MRSISHTLKLVPFRLAYVTLYIGISSCSWNKFQICCVSKKDLNLGYKIAEVACFHLIILTNNNYKSTNPNAVICCWIFSFTFIPVQFISFEYILEYDYGAVLCKYYVHLHMAIKKKLKFRSLEWNFIVSNNYISTYLI